MHHQGRPRGMSDDVPSAEVKAIAASMTCPHRAGLIGARHKGDKAIDVNLTARTMVSSRPS
jgi:hypothetical protein